MIHFLNLIRWKNLVLIALAQILTKHALLLPFYQSRGVVTTLSSFAFALLVVATLCIAAGGYVVGAIYNVETDKVNATNKVIINTHISENTALYLFIALNIIGVVLGFYLSNGIGKSGYFPIFFIASALLYLYSSYLKQLFLIGNVVISMVVALSIVLVGIFELLPAVTPTNRAVQIFFFKIVLDYAIFAFMVNLIRAWVKDIENIDGDHKAGRQTLPIVLGRERANKIVFVLSLIPLFSVVYYLVTNLFKQQILVAYFLFFIIAPLIYITIKLYSAEQKSQYKHISLLLKAVMITSMLSMVLYAYILK